MTQSSEFLFLLLFSCTFYLCQGMITNSSGALDTIKPFGYRMCLDRCKLNSLCLSVVYRRDELTCELRPEPYSSIETTPLELRNMNKSCQEHQNSLIQGKCLEVIQGIRLSGGNIVCILTTTRFANVALGKQANVSSAFDEYSHASSAVDGLWVTVPYVNCSHTSSTNDSYLIVYLERDHYVDHVVILTRGDVDESNVYARGFQKVRVLIGQSHCGYFEGPATPGTNVTFVCEKCLIGKSVLVLNAADTEAVISVCEIMIVGMPKK